VVSVRTRHKLGAADARELLRAAPGVKVLDAPGEGVYPMPMLAVNDDAVLVGRVRAQDDGLDLVLAGDNLRLGGAASAVAAAKLLAERLFSAP
jgi:aspartate-semialdehyde dehydrogenase